MSARVALDCWSVCPFPCCFFLSEHGAHTSLLSFLAFCYWTGLLSFLDGETAIINFAS